MTAEESGAPHAQFEEQLSAYLDGELGEPAKAALERHLGGCMACRAELDRLRATVGKLGALKQRAPASFLPNIQQQIYNRSRGRFFNKRWMLFGRVPFEWVSLAMIVAMLVYYVITLQGSPETVSPGP